MISAVKVKPLATDWTPGTSFGLWCRKRVDIMEEILRCKLNQHELVSETLRDSGDKTIIEMNDDDYFWGWGRDRNGRNELGKLWMKLRDEFSIH